MPKMTVLDMTQDILSDMNSDDVNSIDDSVEALQVANIIRSTYNEIIDGVDYWPHLNTLVQLDASGDNDKPTHMKMPETLQEIRWIKYNKRKTGDTKDKYGDVCFKTPFDFLDYTNQRDSSSSTVTTVTDFSGISIFVRNDIAPTFWTSFDDEWVVFDAHDSVVDDTLQTNKTQVEGARDATFTLADAFVPDLPAKAFSYLLAEAKSTCFNTVKQAANAKEEQKAKRQRYRMSGHKWRHDGVEGFASYGRKRV